MSTSPIFAGLQQAAPVLLPSLLLCDFGNLEREVRRLEEAGVKCLHLDVMDGQFVPNFTYGMTIVSAVRKLTALPLDVHLMIANPQRYVAEFRKAGADVITFHIEAEPNPRPVLEEIRSLGALAGIVLNPMTPVSAVEPCLDLCDVVLVMSVQAGFGGQSFNRIALEKLGEVRRLAPHVLLEIDGGVNEDTVRSCVAAGAQLLVAGSAIFGHRDYAQSVGRLNALARAS